MNLLVFGHLPWSPLWKRNQMMVCSMHKKRIFNKIMFINPSLRLGSLKRDCFRREISIKDKHRLLRLIPSKVLGGLTVLTTFIPSRRKKWDWLNNLFVEFYAAFLLFWLKRNNYWILINDFDSARLRFYKKLCPFAAKVLIDLSDDFFVVEKEDEFSRGSKDVYSYSSGCADIVLCANEHLRNKYQDGRRRFIVFENGVRSSHAFSRSELIDPFVRLGINHPVVGYVGTISRMRFDMDLLRALFRDFPKVSFVFIGMDDAGFVSELLEGYSNCFFVPAVPYDEMVECVKCFNVAIIPHKINEHTEGNSLLKIYQYLAARVPVVSTRVSGVEKIKDVIHIANDHDHFRALIDRVMQSPDAARLEKGYAIAMENTWERKISLLFQELDLT